MSFSGLFAESPASFLVVVALLGLVIGSFLNVVIYRLPIMLANQWKRECRTWLEGEDALPIEDIRPYNLIVPRSRCPHCGHKITALENIPIISYLILRGRCAECRASISVQYPLIEASSAILALLVVWQFGYSWQSAAAMVFTWSLIALSVIDIRSGLLPDIVTLPFLWLGLLVNIEGTFTNLTSSVFGAVFGYLSLWLIYHVFKHITGKEGMGYGDFKLLAMLGAWLGWQTLPLIVILSSFLGAVVGVTLIFLKKHSRDIPMPFGPYLAGAGWFAMLWGSQIIDTYFEYAIG
jgi:leader peptidase (prepilin peptidase)/N-methyltransferase